MKNTFESRLQSNIILEIPFIPTSTIKGGWTQSYFPFKTKFYSDDHLNGLIQLLDTAPLNLMISEYSFRLELSSISGSICLTKILRAEGIIAFYCC